MNNIDKSKEQQVWEKGTPSNEPDVWRKDIAGAWINRDDYGNEESPWGWTIDHIIPVSEKDNPDLKKHIPNGINDISNLQPLHWVNNASKAQKLEFKTIVSSNDKHNVLLQKCFIIKYDEQKPSKFWIEEKPQNK